MILTKKIIDVVLFAVLVVVATVAIKAGGEVDPTFNGSAYGDLTNNGTVNVISFQPDGKMLIGGQFTEVQGFAAHGLARLNADGTVDTTFVAPDFFSRSGITGQYTFGGEVFAIVVLPDGKILVGGNISLPPNPRGGLFRLNADGSIDSSFFAYQHFAIYDMKVLPDGKILYAGHFAFNSSNLARMNADGTPDMTFSADTSTARIKDMEIQPDGKIVTTGTIVELINNMFVYTTYIRRFESNGAADPAFSPTSTGTGMMEALELQADGKIIVGGSYTTLRGVGQGNFSRLNSDGSLDMSFNSGGVGANGSVNDIVIRSDGKLIIGGAFSSYNGTTIQRLARLNADGSRDNTFSDNGVITNSAINDVALLADNRILAGLNVSTVVDSLLRFSADGVFDATFVVRVTRFGVVNEVLEQPDGKILVAGEFRYANGAQRRSIARFNADGTLDNSFVPYFNNLAPLPIINAIALQADGKIVIGTWHGMVLQRLNADGSQDTSFNAGMPSSTQIYDVEVQPDGKILVGGNLTYVLPRFARLNSDGSRDTSFNPGQPNGSVVKIIRQPDAKYLVGGFFSSISDIGVRLGLARYNSDGVLDGSFVPPSGGPTVSDVDLQPDGKVVYVGAGLRRLNADGTLDNSFSQFANGTVNAVKVLPSGRILIGGEFSLIGGVARNGIARLNSNGSLDSGFTTFANRGVVEIELQADGKVLIGGAFTKIDGVPRSRIARLLNTTTPSSTLFDYDGDGKADVSVFRPSENRWYIFRSSDSVVSQTAFAIAGDVPVPADYDGDQKTDIAIYRPSNGAWWYQSSLNGAQINVNWGGETGDIPRPSDWDGDGKTDFVFFRPTNNFWYRISGATGIVSNVQFGLAGDKPVRGDFDGDGKSDVAIYRPSTGDWWYLTSSTGSQLAVRWGISTDIPAPADFDGDGRTDFAVYRPSTGVWYVINSSNGSFLIGPFGIPEDKPVPADYDGDGKAELAVFRPSTGIWYQLRTNGGFFAMQFGVGTDTPTPNAFVP